MSLESGTYVSDLVPTNPLTSDDRSQGDDHIRLIKATLRNTFPQGDRPHRQMRELAIGASYLVVETDDKSLVVINTTSGTVNLTLPALDVANSGWSIKVIKATGDANPIFVLPPSGLIRSGMYSLTKTRRALPHSTFEIIWTGSSFIVERMTNLPVGSLIHSPVAGTPIGYELASGGAVPQTSYPDYFAATGLEVLPDVRGRLLVGRDDMGGVAANRITAAGGLVGTTLGAAGGLEARTIAAANLPAHTHGVSGATDPAGQHNHDVPNVAGTGTVGAGITAVAGVNNQPETTDTEVHHTHNISLTTDGGTGGGVALPTLPPMIVMNAFVVME